MSDHHFPKNSVEIKGKATRSKLNDQSENAPTWARAINESIGIPEHNFPVHKRNARLQLYALNFHTDRYGGAIQL